MSKAKRKHHRKKKQNHKKILGHTLFSLGFAFVFISLVSVSALYTPLIFQEGRYQLNLFRKARVSTGEEATDNASEMIVPVDTEAGIVIPKIRANASIILDVDATNPDVYQAALTEGVAHAKGTAYPGQVGNVFLFAQSAGDIFSGIRYNLIFYLLPKLRRGDEIDLFYHGRQYVYEVMESWVVSTMDITYLMNNTSEPVLSLMTCYPPGTTWKRFVVLAILR